MASRSSVIVLARALVGAAFIAVLGAALIACPSAQVHRDRTVARRLMPATLTVAHPETGEPRVAKVRILADDDFRAQHVHWRDEVAAQLDAANQVLIPAVGLRLDAATVEPWTARSADRPLGDVLADLEAHDPGDGVTFVIGMVSSLSNVSIGFEQLGMARILGRHLVLRGYADQAEHADFLRGLPTLDDHAREALHDARRQHKQTTLMLHELAHALGAVHETDPSWIMTDSYTAQVSTFSDQSRKLMQLVIEARLQVPPVPAGVVAGRVLTFLDENPWGGWIEDDITNLRSTLQAIAAAPATGDTAATGDARDLPVPAAAYPQFQEAQGLAARGKYAEALAALDALIAAYPSAAELRVAVCTIQLAQDGAEAATAIAACDRALEVSPTDPRPLFARIDALAAAGKLPAALALMPRTEALAGDDSASWEKLAAIYQSQTMITAAERAIGHAKVADNHPVRTWAARLRARYGLPPTGKAQVPIADEGAYVAAVREVLDLVYASKFPAAEAKARAADRRWPRTPGVLGARCDLALRKGSAPAASALCDQAIKLWPGAAWAQYLRGVVALQRGKTAPAIVALKAAIAAEPELAAAYRTLGKAYVMAGDKAGHDALDADYQQRFGSRLPD